MRCREARDALWPPELPRLLGPRIAAARAHVRGCPECTLYLAQDRRLLDACHGLRSLRAPTEVRLRVLDAIATAGLRKRTEASRASDEDRVGAKGPSWSLRERARVRVAAGGALALMVAGIALTVVGLRPPAPVPNRAGPPPEDAFVEDYLRRAVGQDFLDSSDREEIARFLLRELGLSSRLLATPGLVPARVEICLLEGRRGAMVVYHFEDRTVTHYLVPDRGAPRAPSVADSRGDLAVVTWSTGSVEEALVGELPASELLALARADALE